MLRAIVIDNSKPQADMLFQDLQDIEMEVEVVSVCYSGIAGLRAIKKYQPDVVFLDAFMPELNGFELLELIDDKNFEVVFITGFEEAVIEAAKKGANHVLFKPVDQEDLTSLIERIKKLRSNPDKGLTQEQMEVLINNIGLDLKYSIFAIPTLKGYVFYPLNDLLYCIAGGNNTAVVVKGKEHISGYPLGEFEKRLPKKLFFRIHNGHIINMTQIKEYLKGNPSRVIMSNNKELKVAEGKKRSFEDRFRW